MSDEWTLKVCQCSTSLRKSPQQLLFSYPPLAIPRTIQYNKTVCGHLLPCNQIIMKECISMRLDKFLKVSRIIKRRTVANEACSGGRVSLNGKVAKPGAEELAKAIG